MNNKKIVQKIVLGGAIVKNNKILILQRHKNEDIYPNMWELPSGKREPLEPSELSLFREIKEEAGIDTKIIMPFAIFDYQIEKPEEIRDSTQINFIVIPKGNKKIAISPEHQRYAWIGVKELNKYNLTASTKKVIKKAFELVLKVKIQ